MAARFSVQHLAEKPRGWRVRSKRSGEHVVRVAFPPGRKRRGSGKVIEVLHPKTNPTCEEGTCGPRSNPAELVIFTNPSGKGLVASGKKKPKGHKANCACPFCKRARGNPPSAQQRQKQKAARERAARIRAARLSNVPPQRMVKAGPGTIGRSLELKHAKKKLAAARRAKQKGDIEFWGGQVRSLRNPSETTQAVRLFQKFHGKDPKGIAEAQRSAVIREDYTAVGKLVALCMDDYGWPDRKITNEWDKLPAITFEKDGVTLASSPNGRQLYFIGGRQNLDACLEDFEGVDPSKDFIDLGEVFVIVYEARKSHNNFEPTDWVHQLGGKNQERPRLMYDKLKKEMFLAGGEYFIDLSKNLSPGIEG
jgi:hypothetical protein